MIAEPPNAAASTEDFEFAALSEARNYRHALVREFAPHLRGRVLEIGAGIGQITGELCELPGLEDLVSVEPSPEFCARFREQHPARRLVEGTVEAVGQPDGWNAILSINVLEHIRDDEGELALYRNHLRSEKGNLCLFVPARPEITAPIDQDFGHFRRYTKPELRRKLEAAGFEILRLDYFNFVGYFAWWLNFCLLKRRSFDRTSVRLFDRCVFPIVYALERGICSPPFGQSLIAVGKSS